MRWTAGRRQLLMGAGCQSGRFALYASSLSPCGYRMIGICLLTRPRFTAIARVRENWLLLALIIVTCCRTGRRASRRQVLNGYDAIACIKLWRQEV